MAAGKAIEIANGVQILDGSALVQQNAALALTKQKPSKFYLDTVVSPTLICGSRASTGGNVLTGISTKTDKNSFDRLAVETAQTGKYTRVSAAFNISAGDVEIATVPTGHTWVLVNVHKGATAGTPLVYISAAAGAAPLTFLMTAATAQQNIFIPSNMIRMVAGEQLRCGAGAGGDVAINIGYSYYDEVNLPGQVY